MLSQWPTTTSSGERPVYTTPSGRDCRRAPDASAWLSGEGRGPCLTFGPVHVGAVQVLCVLMSLDDLLRAVEAGEARAGERLGEALYRELWPYFRKRFEDRDAEDAVQDTIGVVVRELANFEDRGPGSFRSWVFEIARRRALGRRRKLARDQRPAPDLLVAAPLVDPSDWTLLREQGSLVREAMDELDSPLRRVLNHRIDGGDDQEFARAEGIKPGTIRTRWTRAVEALREGVAARRKTATPT